MIDRRTRGDRRVGPLVLREPGRQFRDQRGRVSHRRAQRVESPSRSRHLRSGRHVRAHPVGVLGARRRDGRERFGAPPLDVRRDAPDLDRYGIRIGDRAILLERFVAHVLRGEPRTTKRGRRSAAVECAREPDLEVEFVHGVIELHEGRTGARADSVGLGAGTRRPPRRPDRPGDRRDRDRGDAEDDQCRYHPGQEAGGNLSHRRPESGEGREARPRWPQRPALRPPRAAS